VRVDLQRRDHVEQRIGVDVLLVGVAAQNKLQLRSGHQLANHVLNVVADNAFSGRKVAYAHADNPTLRVRNNLLVSPLLDVFPHRDVLRLPMVGLHLAIKVVRPLILQRKQVETHGHATVDDFLGRKRGFGFRLIEDERLGAYLKRFVHGQRLMEEEK
jgi:hypothetical protein